MGLGLRLRIFFGFKIWRFSKAQDLKIFGSKTYKFFQSFKTWRSTMTFGLNTQNLHLSKVLQHKDLEFSKKSRPVSQGGKHSSILTCKQPQTRDTINKALRQSGKFKSTQRKAIDWKGDLKVTKQCLNKTTKQTILAIPSCRNELRFCMVIGRITTKGFYQIVRGHAFH